MSNPIAKPPAPSPGVLESDSYGKALRVAQEKLRTMDSRAVAERSGAEWVPAADGGGELLVRFLGQDFAVQLPEATVWTVEHAERGLGPADASCPCCQAEAVLAGGESLVAGGIDSHQPVHPPATSRHPQANTYGEASIWDAILILHYLGSDAPVPPRGEPIAFQDMLEGKFYDPAFQGRCRVPLERKFGAAPEKLIPSAEKLGGCAWERGDVSVVVPAFPRVDVHLVLYRGDDEFPPSATVLFSSTVASFLSAEDVAVLGGAVVGRMGRAAAKT